MILFVFDLKSQIMLLGSDTINRRDTNGLKEGLWMDDFMSMQFRGNYVAGKKEGVWVSHNPKNQKINYLIEFHDDKRNGIYVEFNPNGIIIKEEYYKNDLKHGESKEYDIWDLRSVANYKNGLLNGYKVSYYTGNAKSYLEGVKNIQEEAFYINNLRHGETKWYGKNDKLIAKYNYNMGSLEGKQYTFYEDGLTIKTIETYKNNILDGEVKEFYSNGKIKLEGLYLDGKKNGEWREYSEEGKLLKTTKWKDDVENKK